MDNELIITELYREDYKKDPGGRKPKPLKSSWTMNERIPPPSRTTEYWFALDEIATGLTIAKAADLNTAYTCMDKLKSEGTLTVIRPVEISEESLQKETSDRKWKRQHGYI